MFFEEQLHIRHVIGFAFVCAGLAINLHIKQGSQADGAIDRTEASSLLLQETEEEPRQGDLGIEDRHP